MSRSYRKVPIFGIAGDSDADGKRQCAQIMRAREHALLHRLVLQSLDPDDTVFVNPREAMNSYSFPKDGKCFVDLSRYENPKVMMTK